MSESAAFWKRRYDEVQDELSRLREENDAFKRADHMTRQENARLREEIEIWRFNFNEAQAAKDRLREENRLLRQDFDCAGCMQGEVDTLLAALRNLVKDAQAAVDQDNPFLGQQLNDLSWNTIPAARAAISEVEKGDNVV